MVHSLAWGGDERQVNQGFEMGVTAELQSWYEYSADYCLVAGWHAGLDVDMPRMTPIYALTNGVVTEAGFLPYFRPNPVTIKSDNGYIEIYGHMWQDTVKVGDRVRPGDQIGFSGEQTIPGTMTPDGSGPHLHFELRVPNSSCNSGYAAIDPTQYLETNGAVATGKNSTPQPSNNGGTSGTNSSGASGLVNAIGTYAQKSMFVTAGVLILGMGLYFLLSMHTGMSVSKVGKKITKASTPLKVL